MSTNINYCCQSGAAAYSGLSHNRVAWPFIVSATNCNGSEPQLLNCVYSAHFAECGQAEAAFAHCQLGKLHTSNAYLGMMHFSTT